MILVHRDKPADPSYIVKKKKINNNTATGQLWSVLPNALN